MFKNLNASALGVSGHQSEIIELALTYRFQGMDADIVELATRAELHGMPYARRLIDSAGIHIGTFRLPLEWDTDDDVFRPELEKLSEYAQVAAEIGCTRCVATIAPAGDKRPYHENFEFHRHRFFDVSQALEPFNIRLGIGFRAAANLRQSQAFQFIHDLDALSLLVNMIGAPNVGILLDVWDLHVSGGSPENVRSLSAEQIVAVQLADVPAEDTPTAELTEASRRMPLEEGGIDLPAYIVALAEIGYKGPVSFKPDRSALKGRRRDPIVRQVAGAMDMIWKAAGLTHDGKLAAPAGS
ncbi:MAG: sugar phosphate isomerase/epimerase [Planctomycetota bacterium]